MTRRATWAAIMALVLLLDYVSKQWAGQSLRLHQPNELLPWLSLTLSHNTGAAFSFLDSQPGWQRWFLIIIGVGMCAFLAAWLLRLSAAERIRGVALSLVLAGAIGNLIDRIASGYVVDFIDVHIAGWHWPTFNAADSAISVGMLLLALDYLMARPDKSPGPGSTGP